MKRLEAVLALIDKCAVLADIGCDHGLLALSVIKSGLADFIYATDISEKSLDKARELLKGYENAECVVSDGFKSLERLPDTAVIAGLGGREIVRIISGKTVKNLILAPQNQVSALRRELCRIGYRITADLTAYENNKFYDIIKAEYSDGKMEIDEAEAQWGCFYKVKSDLLKKRIELTEKKLLSYKHTDENEAKLKIIREVKKWQQ